MGRPVKNNCDYFPHFTTMRNHKKVKSLRAKFGQVLGYAFWSMFVEYLTEQDGTEIEFSDLEIEMFSGELGVSATEIRSMIDYCIKIELLFLTDDNFIYSDSLNELLQPVFDKRQNAKERSKTRERHVNGQFSTNNSTKLGVSATEIPQIEVKKIKENNKEENNNKEINKEKSNGGKPPILTIDERKENFKNELKPFLEKYGKELLNEFYSYWTEKTPTAKKMRFEKQDVFEVSKRLATWEKNNKAFNKQIPPPIKSYKPDTSAVDKAAKLQEEFFKENNINHGK